MLQGHGHAHGRILTPKQHISLGLAAGVINYLINRMYHPYSCRLFFDNAGCSLRLKAAEAAFHRADQLPDCSEYSTPTARYPEEAEQAGIKDRGHNTGAPFRL